MRARDPLYDPGVTERLRSRLIAHGYSYSVYFLIGYTSYGSCREDAGMKTPFLHLQAIFSKGFNPVR
jgi:hypothetical protein